ncbi:MAG TPA: SDR family oxidoreductase, partial [Gemmatimonadaceae bacterium]|nr:SDR family oxidoreductase [Gemmatimonadaceae bacterium]
DAPTISTYPYGISKLQGEKAALQLASPEFSVIVLRQGTVSGYSPRMRLDLIVNAMFRSALTGGTITVNNPAIWRPVLGMADAVQAYLRAVDAAPPTSGVFNVASGNWTVGDVAATVQRELTDRLGAPVTIDTRHIPDVRNYRVSTARAERGLGFAPRADIATIVGDLWEHRGRFADLDSPQYRNIDVFKTVRGMGEG